MAKKHLSLLLTASIFLFSNPLLASDNDPHEKLNRIFYHFNDVFDRLILKPTAFLYNQIVPKPLNKGISNIFSNVEMIPTVINDLLQFNIHQALSDSWRFGINSTLGIGGFFDIATDVGLPYNHQDFGLTLARWGWKHSDYLVLPFLGPSTIRDGAAWPINYEYMTVYPHIEDQTVRYAVYGTDVVSIRARMLRYEGIMEEAALDRYAFMRDAYLQNRNHKIELNERRAYFGKGSTDKELPEEDSIKK